MAGQADDRCRKVGGLLADPDDHYVNAHTDEWPGGAPRGQLTDEPAG